MRRLPNQKSRAVVFAFLALTLAAASLGAADLTPEALAGWRAYVAATEERRAHERPADGKFLALDYASTDQAHRREVLAGRLVIKRGRPASRQGREVDVPDAIVNHWIGSVFIPDVSLDVLLSKLLAGPPPQVDIMKSAVLARDGNSMRVFLRLRRTKIVTVFYDTEHEIQFVRLDPKHASSTSVATRIVQLENAGTPTERALPAGSDDGYLWRLNAYWRYEEVAGGVIAECESLSLSRSVPFGLRTITAPLINSAARESMEAALGAVLSLRTLPAS